MIKTKIVGKIFMIMLFTALMMQSCNVSKAVKGGAIGAVGGAAIGGLIGHKSGNTATGAIIGAAVGGTAGILIGRYMDKQAAELKKDLKGATVERVGEGIKITFNTGLLFTTNSYGVQSASKKNLQELAEVLNKYDDTEVLIEGHTDNAGSDANNQTLSENRASSVKSYLASKQVSISRFTTIGYGENQPVADNTTKIGRQKNRRVEVAIFANKKLKKAAKKGQI